MWNMGPQSNVTCWEYDAKKSEVGLRGHFEIFPNLEEGDGNLGFGDHGTRKRNRIFATSSSTLTRSVCAISVFVRSARARAAAASTTSITNRRMPIHYLLHGVHRPLDPVL